MQNSTGKFSSFYKFSAIRIPLQANDKQKSWYSSPNGITVVVLPTFEKIAFVTPLEPLLSEILELLNFWEYEKLEMETVPYANTKDLEEDIKSLIAKP